MIIFLKAHIDTYTKKDGTVVAAHEDKRSKHSPEQIAKWAAEKKARESAQATQRLQEIDAEKQINQRRADGVASTAAGRDFESSEVESIRSYYLSGDKHGAMAEGRNAAVAAIERQLRAEGIEIDHVSESQGGKSKSLYVKVGDEIVRVSDHELPETPERSANRDAGRSGRWSREVIVSDWRGTPIADYVADIKGRVVTKAHPATQAMSAARAPADLMEPGLRRSPGEPSAAQVEAEAYNKPRIQWQGLTIAVENPAGSVRRGTNRHGVSWEIRMRFDYGEVVGSMGVDGDPVDIYMGPNPDAPMVYVVHQRRVNDWEAYDEDKVMAGFDCQADAEDAFLSNYNDPRFLGPVTAMPVADFVAKVRATKEKPAMIKSSPAVVLFFKAHVGAYLRGGKMVNINGYQGRAARAVATQGQLSLFGANKPMGPSPFKGRDPVASTPDMFSADAKPQQSPSPADEKSQAAADAWDRNEDRNRRVSVDMSRARSAMPHINGTLTPEGIRMSRTLEEVVDGAGQRPFITADHGDDVEIATSYYGEGMKTIRVPRSVVSLSPIGGKAGEAPAGDDKDRKTDFDESLQILRAATKAMAEASARKKAAKPNSIEYGLAHLDEQKAWAEVARSNVVGYPHKEGPEYESRQKNLEASLAAVARTEEILRTLSQSKPKAGEMPAQAGEQAAPESAGSAQSDDDAPHVETKDGIPEKSTKPIVNDRAGDLARRLRDSVDKSAKDDATKSRMYASEAQRLRGSAGAVRTTPDVAKQYSEAADILDAWAKTLGGGAGAKVDPSTVGGKPNADYNAAVTSEKEGPTDNDPRRKFYVTVARAGRGVGKLAGPFDTHDEAKAHVSLAREHAHQVDPRSAFDAFGTVGVVADDHKPGVLNERLGVGVNAEVPKFTDATTPPPKPGVYKLANGTYAKFDRIWWRGEDTPQKAMRTEMISGATNPKDRAENQAWMLHAEFTRDVFGDPKRLKPAPMVKSIMFLRRPAS